MTTWLEILFLPELMNYQLFWTAQWTGMSDSMMVLAGPIAFPLPLPLDHFWANIETLPLLLKPHVAQPCEQPIHYGQKPKLGAVQQSSIKHTKILKPSIMLSENRQLYW